MQDDFHWLLQTLQHHVNMSSRQHVSPESSETLARHFVPWRVDESISCWRMFQQSCYVFQQPPGTIWCNAEAFWGLTPHCFSYFSFPVGAAQSMSSHAQRLSRRLSNAHFAYFSNWLIVCQMNAPNWAATNLENLEKSGNLTVDMEKSRKVKKNREKSGKCVLPVVCYCDCNGHRTCIAWLPEFCWLQTTWEWNEQ